MHHGARKKRKLSSSSLSDKDAACAATEKTEKQQTREKERILLARASVIKVPAAFTPRLDAVCVQEKYRRLVPAYDTPWKEPPHNATHWDHLLSEATWMWNDISQERLWKEAVAKQLAYEAMEYWKTHFNSHSSESSSEMVTVTKDEVFGVHFGRQFRAGLQEMVRKSHRKKTMRYEKTLRKFQKKYEVEEAAAIYGFEPDERFCLLNIKIPTLPCVAAPNEVEKEAFMMSPAKAVGSRHSTRPISRTPAAKQMLETEEMLGNGRLMSCRRPRPGRDKRQRADRPVDIHGATSRPTQRPVTRRWEDARIPGSDVSLSQPENEARQDPPTINDFLARNDDQLLFFASNELQANWQIVSDVMASAGIYMSPETCRDRLKSIESIIGQAQSQIMRPLAQAAVPPGMLDDALLKQLRAKAKDILKKGIPEMLAAKFTQHTCTAHKKRCLKIKKAMHEGNIGPPINHVSQRKLSEDVTKAMGGRLATPRESWTEARCRNVARISAEEFRRKQLDAAEVAARQRLWRSSSSQSMAHGNASLDAQRKYQASQQQGTMQLAVSLADSSGWGAPNGMPSGFMNGGGPVGASHPPASHLQTAPWIPPSDMLKGLTQFPNLMGSTNAQGQPVVDGSSMMPPVRPVFRNMMPQLMGVQRHSVEPPMRGPRGPVQNSQHQMTMAYAQQQSHQYMTQVFRRFQNNPAMLRQFLHSSSCTPEMRRLIVKTLQERPTRTQRAMTGQMATHPSQMQQRMAPAPTAPQVMSPGTAARMPSIAVSGDGHGGHPGLGMPHSSFPAPPSLDHPSQYNARAVPSPRDYVEPPGHGVRPRTQRPNLPPGYDYPGQMDSAMNAEMQQGGYGAMPMRMHGANPDMMSPVGPQRELRPGMSVDGRHVRPDGTAVQMMDPTHGVGNPEGPQSEGNYTDARGLPGRPLPSPYARGNPRPYGK